MDQLNALLALLAGIAVRLVIPVFVTAAIVILLRKLDEHWQLEARTAPAPIEKPACWEIKGCSPEAREKCPGYLSALPCWHAQRSPNGYLRDACLECQVFVKAPIPNLA